MSVTETIDIAIRVYFSNMTHNLMLIQSSAMRVKDAPVEMIETIAATRNKLFDIFEWYHQESLKWCPGMKNELEINGNTVYTNQETQIFGEEDE